MKRDILLSLGGLGDELMLTRIVALYAEHYRTSPSVITRFPELFAGNPNVRNVYRFRPPYRFSKLLATLAGFRLRRVGYHDQHHSLSPLLPQQHVLVGMAQRLGIPSSLSESILPDPSPLLYSLINQSAVKTSNKINPDLPVILVQSSARGARFPIPLKEWNVEENRMVELFKHYGPSIRALGYSIIQVGLLQDPRIEGAVDLRGRTNLRELVDTFLRASLFIGLEGGLMHLARATNCGAIIVYGGRVLPSQIGYKTSNFINISSRAPCSPCWLNHACPYTHKCMKEIEIDEVYSVIEGELKRMTRQRYQRAGLLQ